MLLNDFAYNFLKRLCQIILPAISSLYFGLAQIWGLPWAEQIVGTLALICTFLGVILGISSNQYNKSDAAYDGTVVVTNKSNGMKNFSLELNGDPEAIENMNSVRFKVAQSQ